MRGGTCKRPGPTYSSPSTSAPVALYIGGYGGLVRFSKQTVGFWILEECRRFWKERDREIDESLLTHLASSSPPFDSLINPADPRFLVPGDMPLKIQAFCRETNQRVPRKPGPIIRCVLESLALQYRKTLEEIETLTGQQIKRLYLLGGPANSLLNHFIANALRRPLVVGPADAAAIGNVLVQALGSRPPRVPPTGAGSRAPVLQDGDDHSVCHRVGYVL